DDGAPLVVLEDEVPPVANLKVEEPGAAWPAVMEHQRFGQLQNRVARHLHPMCEVAVLLPDEIPLVEQSDVDRDSAVEEQRAGRRRPDIQRLAAAVAQRPIEPGIDGLADEMHRAG